MSNKIKLEQLFGEIQQSKWKDAARQRKENKSWLRYSQEIAFVVLEQLDLQEISQKSLAEKMNVSPQMVSKWLKGTENFTLDTISKLESVLGISLLNIGTKPEKKKASAEVTIQFSGKYDMANRIGRPSSSFKKSKCIIVAPGVSYRVKA